MTNPVPSERRRVAILFGRDHPRLGGLTVVSASATVAVGTTAGAVPKWTPPVDPNEDVGAAVRGARADLLVVGDAHFGCEASEFAVAHVLAAVGEDPPPADLAPEGLAELVYDAGVEVRQGTGLPDSPHPDSRTTLALALVTDSAVQWATFGDSYVLLLQDGELRRLDAPQSAYLGDAFDPQDIQALMSHGRAPRRPGDLVLAATDGFEGLTPVLPDLAALMLESMDRGYGAGLVVEDILRVALECEVSDATTIAAAI